MSLPDRMKVHDPMPALGATVVRPADPKQPAPQAEATADQAEPEKTVFSDWPAGFFLGSSF